MRPYETMVVLSPGLGEEADALVDRLTAVVETNGGSLDASHDWGSRKLNYPIRRQSEGRYFLFEYQAEPSVVRELERTMRITEGVLRFISVQQEHTGLPEVRQREERPRRDVPLSELRSRPADAAAEEPANDEIKESGEPHRNGDQTEEKGAGDSRAEVNGDE
jgi:small subunit ribosomal protein S6